MHIYDKNSRIKIICLIQNPTINKSVLKYDTYWLLVILYHWLINIHVHVNMNYQNNVNHNMGI